MKIKTFFDNLDLKFFYLFLFLIPFQVSLFLGNINKSWSFYNDFIGFWLYLSDILLILILVFGWRKLYKKRNWIPAGVYPEFTKDLSPGMTDKTGMINTTGMTEKKAGKALISFFLWAALSICWSLYYQIAIYHSIKLLLFVFLFFYIQKVIATNGELRYKTYLTLFIAGIIQSFIGIWQFLAQKSIGLKLLGEPVFTQTTAGIAKLDYNGEKIVRAYGTLPHPNILGGFLLLAFVCGILWTIKRKKKCHAELVSASRDCHIKSPLPPFSKEGEYLAMTTIITCLILTFSRSAWVAGGVILIFSSVYFFINKQQSVIPAKAGISVGSILLPRLWNHIAKWLHSPKGTMEPTRDRKKNWIPVFTGMTITLIILCIFTFPLIKNRFTSYKEAIESRKLPTTIAIETIKQEPFLGVGWGNFIPQALGITKNQTVEQWEIQPVHNIYLLLLAELGIIGLIFFFNFLIKLLKQAFKQIKNSPETFLLTMLFCGFLIIGLFDHYFFTLQQGMLIFWLGAGFLGYCHCEEATADKAISKK